MSDQPKREIIRVEIPEIQKWVKGKSIGGHTLLGVNTSKYPVKHGNCFDMVISRDKGVKIVNFYVENLEELIRRNEITLPVKIGMISEHCGVIMDERIPHDWYSDRFCEVCCPDRLLPITQRLRIWRDEESGKRVTTKSENGYIITSIRMGK
jgi:hypothetical protein